MTTSVSGTRNGAVDLHPVDPRAVDTSIPGDSTSVEDAGAMPQVEPMGTAEQVALFGFIAIPLLAILAAIPAVWKRGLGWHDVLIATVMYAVAGHGITVGFHRYFTHGSFKATRRLQIALAIAGSLTIEGPVIRWAADHCRHHAFSDREGDPHSPWRYGETVPALMRGLWWANTEWLFNVEQTSRVRYAPDLTADRNVRRATQRSPHWSRCLCSLRPSSEAYGRCPGREPRRPSSGGRWSVSGCSTTSPGQSTPICHPIGERPFTSRDKSANVWWLAILSMGESWHNLHHADQTCARRGVDRGQPHSTARTIWAVEKLGWASDVRWPRPERLDDRRRQ
jgi:stearoyl-CoA desaturase (delta-9 desaturase)